MREGSCSGARAGYARVVLVSWLILTLQPIAHARSDLQRDWPRTDFSNALIDLDAVRSGGPPKDGIPAIDEPRFEQFETAERWLGDREPVIALSAGDEARAYPLQIMIWHEIVNDTVGGRPVAVTFCPLCNAAIAFDRRSDTGVLDFGTTGRLHKSDLVMYDRQTESWWQQFTGQAVVGALAGRRLERIAAPIVAFGDFRTQYPEGQVLSRDTGHVRDYGRNPYRGYDRVGETPFLFDDPLDPRLPAMERVLGVSVRDVHRLYPFGVLGERPVINDEIMQTPVVVISRNGVLSALDATRIRDSREIAAAAAYDRRIDGRRLTFELRDGVIVDTESGSVWSIFGRAVSGPLEGSALTPVDEGVHFAFAWLAFRPESQIYNPDHRSLSP